MKCRLAVRVLLVDVVPLAVLGEEVYDVERGGDFLGDSWRGEGELLRGGLSITIPNYHVCTIIVYPLFGVVI